MTIRYYANGARFQPGNFVTFADVLLMRLLRARDKWDVCSILLTGHPLPPVGGLLRLSAEDAAELRARFVERWPALGGL